MKNLHKILFFLVLIGSLVGCNNQPNVGDNNNQTEGPNISTVTVNKDNVDNKEYYVIDLRVVDTDGVNVVTVGFVTKSGAAENTSMVLKEGDQYDGWYRRAISTPDEPIKKLEIWALDQKGNESLKEIAYEDLLIQTTY